MTEAAWQMYSSSCRSKMSGRQSRAEGLNCVPRAGVLPDTLWGFLGLDSSQADGVRSRKMDRGGDRVPDSDRRPVVCHHVVTLP